MNTQSQMNNQPQVDNQSIMSEEQPDPRVMIMVRKVLDEAIIVHSDKTHDWPIRAVMQIMKIAKRFKCDDGLFEAIMNEEQSGRCCSSHNQKLPGSFGRVNLFILKLFRFPALRFETQIKSNRFCRYSYKPERKDVCLNPYHYVFLLPKAEPVPAIVINKDLNYGAPPMRFDFSYSQGSIAPQYIPKGEPSYDDSSVPNITIDGDEIKMLYENHASLNQFTDAGPSSSTSNQVPPSMPPIEFTSPIASPDFLTRRPEDEDEQFQYRSGMSSPASDIGSPRVYVPQINHGFRGDDDEMEGVEEERGATNVIEPIRVKTPEEARPLFRTTPNELADLARNAGCYECVEYEENPNWLGLLYYEMGTNIGDMGLFSGQHCLIDGFTSTGTTSQNRFSVGFYNNPERSDAISTVRSAIGRGVRLYLLAGEVYIENLCEVNVFVQSLSTNLSRNLQLNTVTKLKPRGTMKIFDMRQFSKQLAMAAERTYQDVYCLSRMCTIRMSFCKGWGRSYKHGSILECPVWIQAHLNNPLAWIDSVLNCMGAPSKMCNSRT